MNEFQSSNKRSFKDLSTRNKVITALAALGVVTAAGAGIRDLATESHDEKIERLFQENKKANESNVPYEMATARSDGRFHVEDDNLNKADDMRAISLELASNPELLKSGSTAPVVFQQDRNTKVSVTHTLSNFKPAADGCATYAFQRVAQIAHPARPGSTFKESRQCMGMACWTPGERVKISYNK